MDKTQVKILAGEYVSQQTEIARLTSALEAAEKQLDAARDDLGKVIVYPWDSEDEVEAHIIESQARIDASLAEIADIKGSK